MRKKILDQLDYNAALIQTALFMLLQITDLLSYSRSLHDQIDTRNPEIAPLGQIKGSTFISLAMVMKSTSIRIVWGNCARIQQTWKWRATHFLGARKQ